MTTQRTSRTRTGKIQLLIGLVLLSGVVALVSLWMVVVPEVTWPGGSPKSIAIAINGLAFVTDSGRGSTSINASGIATWVVDIPSQKQIALLRGGTLGKVFVSKQGKVFLLGSPLTYVIDSTAYPLSFTQVIRFPITEAAMSWTAARSATELPTGDILIAVDTNLYRLNQDYHPLLVRRFEDNIYDLVTISRSTRSLYVSTSHHVWILNPDTLEIIGEVQTNQHDVPLENLELVSDDLIVGSFEIHDRSQGDLTQLALLDSRRNAITQSPELTNAHILGIVQASETKIYVLYSRRPRLDQNNSFTTNTGIYYVSVVNLPTLAVTKRIDLPSEPLAPAPGGSPMKRLAKAPDGKVYVVYGYGYVNIFGKDFTRQTGPGLVRIDPQSDDIIGKIPFSVPWTVALNPF
ncbi:MAG: hypothetical protein C4294_19090 [Nitrospiraceae bacterium]